MGTAVLRILVAEADPLAGRVLAGLLADQGHEVTLVTSAAAAIESMRLSPFPVVMAAADLPAVHGQDLCDAIRTAEWDTTIHFVLMGDRYGERIAQRSLEAGADDFLAKPFSADEVLARLRVAQRVIASETHDVTIFALAKLAESRDTDTGRHIERVQAYCQVLGEHMLSEGRWPEVNAGFVKLLLQTAPLHDIGKVSVPDAVLLKPGKLSPAEFEVMKTHTVCGADTLAAAAAQRPRAAYLEMARQIALSHHEKWDGSGYPEGLTACDIPLAARVVAVADVYDALTSRRIYKDAYNHETARTIILDGSGTHFDPLIVEVFRRVETQFARIRERLSERVQMAA